MTKKPKAGALFGAPKPEPETEALPQASRTAAAGDDRLHRIGKKSLTVWVPELGIRQLKAIAAEEGKTMQDKMIELLNREFARTGRPEI